MRRPRRMVGLKEKEQRSVKSPLRKAWSDPQRYRGQRDRVLGAASIPPGIVGMVVVGLLACACCWPAIASAGSPNAAPDPAPQVGSTGANSAGPSPDPSPPSADSLATKTSTQSVSSTGAQNRPVSTTTAPASSSGTDGNATAPERSMSTTPPRSGSTPAGHHSASAHRKDDKADHELRPTPASTRRHAVGPLTTVLGRIDQLFGPNDQPGVGVATHPRPDGLLLLLTAIALGAVVVASSSLRRLLGRMGTELSEERT